MVKQVSFTPYGGDTIKALQARQAALQQSAPPLPDAGNMRSPFQGASYMANTLVNTLQQNAAASQEHEARGQLAKLMSAHAEGQPWQNEELANIYAMEPDLGTHLMDLQAAAAKQENWVDIPAPEGAKPGQQWQRNTITGEQKAVGGQATTQIGSGETSFQVEAGKNLANSMKLLADDAVKSQGDSAKLNQLEGYLKKSGGAITGLKALAMQMGIPVEGADDLAAAQSLISSMIPSQREQGTGTVSDADLAQFKASLPRLLNQPGGNAKIIATLKGIMGYRREQGLIAQKVLSGQISQDKAYESLMAIKSPMLDFPLEVPGADAGTLNAADLTAGQLYSMPNGKLARWGGQGDPSDIKNWKIE